MAQAVGLDARESTPCGAPHEYPKTEQFPPLDLGGGERCAAMRSSTRPLVSWLLVLSAAVGSQAAEPVRFSITADNRGHSGFANILKQIAKLPGGAGLFMLSAGDAEPPQTTRSQLDDVLGKSFVWYPVMGNHELNAKPPDPPAAYVEWLREYYDKKLKGKVNPGPEGAKETCFSFDVGDVHIAVINQYWGGEAEPGNDRVGWGTAVKELRKWLADDLQKSPNAWKLVVGHEPAYPQPDRDWDAARHSRDAFTLDLKTRQRFWTVLEEQGVAAYVCGHTHRYSRYQPEGSKVWQIDVAQARGDKSWQYDAFVIVTADAKSLEFDTYRNLKKQGEFELTDSLKLKAAE